MKNVVMTMLVIMTLGTWGMWVGGLINQIEARWMKPLVWSMLVLTPFTVAYGTYYGAS